MLDRLKLVTELYKVADKLFVDATQSYHIAQDIWRIIIVDPLFIHKVRAICNPPWPVPLWDGDLGDIISVCTMNSPYIALSVDGSQIYPDRHNILSCFLINTGSVVLPYNLQGHVQLFSEPVIFAATDENQQSFSTDAVNCKRQELELAAGLNLSKKIKNEYNGLAPSVLLFDGSLIFWHLSSKEVEVRDQFLDAYFVLLDQLYQEKMLICWYISMPKSKELMSLVRLYLSDFNPQKKELYASVDAVVDSGIMHTMLQPYTRSIIFSNHSAISHYYPNHLRPFFFYIHTGHEIGRVEIPAWIAQDEQAIDLIAQIIIDQCIKGGGYPVALAEAHEQAVVKGPDRDFFYHFLQKIGMERNYRATTSRKSMKKRGIGI